MDPGKWTWDGYEWVGERFNVQPRSMLTPTHDSDDETCMTVYVRTDTQEMIWP